MAIVHYTTLRPAAKLIVARAVERGRFTATRDGVRFTIVEPDRGRAATDLDSVMVAIEEVPRKPRRHDDYATNAASLPNVDRLTHPTDASYAAGAALARTLHARGVRERATFDTNVTTPANRAEDREAFLDGFWNAVNSATGDA